MTTYRIAAVSAVTIIQLSAASFASDADIFAPGIISTEFPEFATSFSPDGQTVFFNRMSADRKIIRLWTSTFSDGEWSEPEPLAFSDGAYRDVDPFMSHDGKRLYFSSTRPLEGEEAKDYDLWYSERVADGWSEPINLGPDINTENPEIYSTLSANGNLYYSAFDSGFETVGIYRARWRNGRFSTPELLTIGDGNLRLTNPTIAPDESYLLMVADPVGQADIFISRRQDDGSWSDATVLGPAVNSDFTEFAPSISPDGAALYFTSERPGIVPAGGGGQRAPGDIYTIPAATALNHTTK